MNTASSTRGDVDGYAGVLESLKIAGNGARGDAESVGELLQRPTLRAADENDDELMLTFDSAEREVGVARRGGNLSGWERHELDVKP